jgi:predicted permease
MQQLKIALRRLWRQPTFFAAAIAVLAIGIAAPTALFAVAHATLLRPLPYPRADEIYTVRTTFTDGRFTIGLVAGAEMNALRRTTDLVVQSALTRRETVTLRTATGVRQTVAYLVSPGFFDLFGVPMAAGRPFNDDDLKSFMGSRVVLAHRAWLSWFGGDPAVIGQTIRLADGPGSLVVGIAPPTLAIARDADLYVAMTPDPGIGHYYEAYVRLKPGITPEILQPRLSGMWAELARQYPDQSKNCVFVMRPLFEAIVGDVRPVVVMAFSATGLLLLLAMVNVANLLLARGTARAREMAVRAALGATRRDLFVHAVSESLLIAGAATAVALPLASAAVRAILAIGGAALPRADDIRVDGPVFLFAAAAMIIAGLGVGLAPLVTMGARRVVAAINEGGRAALQGRTTRRVLAGMVVAEIALAIALAAGAGRLLLSMNNLLNIDPGFTAEGRLAIDAALPVRPYLREPERLSAWIEQAEERLRALGATEVGVASSLPLRRELDTTTFVDITGRPTEPASRPNGRLRIVNAGFFAVMNIPIVAGRAFTRDDRLGSEPVVVVNRAWARKFLPGLDPLRERVTIAQLGTRVDGRFVPRDAAIVGIAGDVSYASLTAPVEPTVYVSVGQVMRPLQTLIITTADGQPERLVARIRSELAAIDPAVPLDFLSMSQALSTSLTWPKLGVLLTVTFGLAGLVLAASGVFGVVAFVGAQRASEMAVRIALGATSGRIFRLVVVEAAALTIGGLLLGLFLAWGMGAAMARYVYHVTPANPLVLGGSAALVFAIAIAATLVPASRAARTEPARVLRS